MMSRLRGHGLLRRARPAPGCRIPGRAANVSGSAQLSSRALPRSEPHSRNRVPPVRTFSPKAADITREWHVIDAEGAILGRLATEIATLLRGKHKPTWAPHLDTGGHVVIVNAAKLAIGDRKLHQKTYHRHSGYPGGIRSESLEHLLGRNPERV